MAKVTIFLLCSFFVVFAQGEVILEADQTWLRVKLSDEATLKCCYKVHGGPNSVIPTWIKHVKALNGTLNKEKVKNSENVTVRDREENNSVFCGKLFFKSVELNDTGLYRCHLNVSEILTYGTYLQVYEPLKKTINLSESTKNKILTAEGILLLICVLVPCATLLCKSKKLQQLEKKKMSREEENIYQGLNLDDCCTTYDQIERSQQHGPYQDVGNVMEDDEEIQLEKP
ncbi:B-cell antigen receptor complex-associated protein alpha chain [Thunnus albacares]|uniref:B-cell antigen receptor complex-associated protein alpha chain n=1 Tax=Thunnus albacares TaxID=8236 RepID=UPI001CF640AF|nr:B-cell antigen receptor complex-associated protein alpha chain [Thunnus albacares]